MVQEGNVVEQAVSRAVRENLAVLQRTAEELRKAVDDLVTACASSRPSNALPPMLRAQAAAAALAAALEVLSRFLTGALQAQRMLADEALPRQVSLPVPEPAPAPTMPPPSLPVPMADQPRAPAPEHASGREAAPPPGAGAGVAEPAAEPERVAEVAVGEPGFDVKSLSYEHQELHRRASRHAKVAMQDIKLIRPEQLRLGRENRDICQRLRDDIDKARKEYDRRFRPILDHPVDYFYDWMVRILAEGDAEKLGQYPYPSTLHRR